MANCPSCGAPIDAHLDKCPYCGASIPQKQVAIEQPAQPQVIVQQIVQEDPYAQRREQERQDRKYKLRKASDIYQLVVGGILLVIAIPFITSSSDWVMYVSIFGASLVGVGIRNLMKHKKEYEQNKI